MTEDGFANQISHHLILPLVTSVFAIRNSTFQILKNSRNQKPPGLPV